MPSVKTHKLPKETTTFTFNLPVFRPCALKQRQISVPAGIKQTIFMLFFFLLLSWEV